MNKESTFQFDFMKTIPKMLAVQSVKVQLLWTVKVLGHLLSFVK